MLPVATIERPLTASPYATSNRRLPKLIVSSSVAREAAVEAAVPPEARDREVVLGAVEVARALAGHHDPATALMRDGVGDVVAIAEVDRRSPVAGEALVEAAIGEIAGHGEVRAVQAVAALLHEPGGHDPAVGSHGHVEGTCPVQEPERGAHHAALAEPGSRLPSGR